jgi:hypothetical protein
VVVAVVVVVVVVVVAAAAVVVVIVVAVAVILVATAAVVVAVAAAAVVVIRPNFMKPCYKKCFLLSLTFGISHNRIARNMATNRTKCQRSIRQSMEIKRSST